MITGTKISEFIPASIETLINNNGQVPVAISNTENFRVSVSSLRGHQGNQGDAGTDGLNGSNGSQGTQGNQGNQGDPGSNDPAGTTGQVQYNNNGVMGGAPLTHVYGSTGSWYYNRFTFDRPAETSDTKTTGISRISYLNAAELMIWASSSGSNTIEICSDDTNSRNTYATFNSSQSKIRQAVIVPTTTRTNATTLDLGVNTRAILSGGTTCAIIATSVESGLAFNSNYEVMIINKNSEDATFAGYTLLTNTTGIFSYDGTGSNWTLLGRFTNV